MTPDQQRIAIATACGWTDTQIIDGKYGQTDVPDYIGDLNACHEMEKALIRHGDWAVCDYDQRRKWNATAAQKAEAFLRTLGLWQETPTQPQ
jgi:hypothetical protein